MSICQNPDCGRRLAPSTGRPRKWCSERCRRTSYRGVCVDCGASTYGGNAIPPERCKDCSPAHRKVWTREAIVAAIREFDARYGRPPGAMDFNVAQARAKGLAIRAERFYRDGDYPHLSLVQRTFGSWSAAVEAAGFVPRPYGTHIGDYTAAQVEEMVALYRSGLSTCQVAEQTGHSVGGVYYHVKKHGALRPFGVAQRLRWAREREAA